MEINPDNNYNVVRNMSRCVKINKNKLPSLIGRFVPLAKVISNDQTWGHLILVC
jgi:hypothetical protein